MKHSTDKKLFLKINYKKYIDSTWIKYPTRGLVVAHHGFKTPYPPAVNTLVFGLAYMDLLIQGVYPVISGFTKFTPIVECIREGASLTIAMSQAVKLTYETYGDETPLLVPKEIVYQEIMDIIRVFNETYKTAVLTGVTIRAFSSNFKPPGEVERPSLEESDQELLDILLRYNSIQNMVCPPSSDKLGKPSYIKKIKPPRNKELNVFLVGDIETLRYPMGKGGLESHLAYAAGYMVVTPGRKPVKGDINRYYAEDYKPILDDPLERSGKLLSDMIESILSFERKHRRPTTLYFHNMGKFDGILILRHLTLFHDDLHIEEICRNSRIYEISVYTISGEKQRKRRKIRILDSCMILPGNLEELAFSFCPNEKGKGKIDHDSVTLDTLGKNRKEYLEYMDQDILLLAHIMQKAQAINMEEYKIDIVNVMTISSFAMTIFRTDHYDDVNHRIYIPNQNADNFIRSGFYGGHADMYIPYGEGLYIYDVNSLYPSVMASHDMPGGKPVWHSDLSEKTSGMKLHEMFGFIKALVVCPDDMERPFLPYRGEDKTLIFPTGTFEGVYFSEELKYAVSLGYRVYPLSGYLFTRMESPFQRFVNDLYDKRLKAKKMGEHAKAFILKTVMNSLYGRFGISPESTISKIVSEDEAIQASMTMPGFINYEVLGNNKCTISYKSKPTLDGEWKPPANSAVHISAAITAYARIKMYPFISRDDCYYTDTDSIIIKSPLPEEDVSPTELGKFKLEKLVSKGIFLAPKAYYIYPSASDAEILKHKGAGKAMATQQWFESMLEDPELKETFSYEKKFHRNWPELLVQCRDFQITIGLNSKKRIHILNSEGRLVGTKPIHVGTDQFKNLGPTPHRAITAGFFLQVLVLSRFAISSSAKNSRRENTETKA